MQALHADIASAPDAADDHPRAGRGRFHHLFWKPAGDCGAEAAALCTTEVAPAAFTDGEVRPEHYEALERAGAPAIALDSECLHRGGGTPRCAAWTATCTLQLASSSGWAALPHDGRCEPAQLARTIPVSSEGY